MAAVSATPASNINRPPAQLEEWLALRTEAPLEPAQPILDAHIHLWNGNRGRFIANEFRSGAQGHNVLAALFVQCYTHYRPCGPDLEQPLGETEFVLKLAEAENLVEEAPVMAPSIVGFANLAYGARIRPMLEQHIQLAKGRFRGVRHGLQYSASGVGRNGPWQPANGQMYTADFREGFAELEPLGLSFDAWLYHPQIPDLVDLARRRRLPAEATGGSIATVTNFGTFGLEWATPIPLPEQTLVLGMGAGRVMPRWDADSKSFHPATEAHFTLSFDHRVLDGGGAGRLLARISELLQAPHLL